MFDQQKRPEYIITNKLVKIIKKAYPKEYSRFKIAYLKDCEENVDLLEVVYRLFAQNNYEINDRAVKAVFYATSLYCCGQAGTDTLAIGSATIGMLLKSIDKITTIRCIQTRKTLFQIMPYLKQAVIMGKKNNLFIDYGLLAVDLADMQKSEKNKNKVLSQWVREAVIYRKDEETKNEQ